ncbi:hypothetical protein [Pontixanthobacter aquaemixtae]|uniref:Uncharacterized protein n=1 Tax=Pontixanthobacter aquaemixtae TaxID=1958940 RepID=A0A844ZW14_9SPHN|nr:hypothetical protein [Pontixanthobacter aquaemixtae]MXO91146.1 hypothetical protein [Pontixanthobacter aquaemixtae]
MKPALGMYLIPVAGCLLALPAQVQAQAQGQTAGEPAAEISADSFPTIEAEPEPAPEPIIVEPDTPDAPEQVIEPPAPDPAPAAPIPVPAPAPTLPVEPVLAPPVTSVITSASASLALVEPAADCRPSPRPCVQISGLPGLSFYIVNRDRFRHWATRGGRLSFDAGRGIDRMISIGSNFERMPRSGAHIQQLGQLGKDYWIIPWCAREIDGREVFKASWQTREKIVMHDEIIAEAAIACQ